MPLTDILSPALQAVLAPGYRWLGSEEPWSHFAAEGAPLAVAMSANATGVLDGVFTDPDELLLTSRRDQLRAAPVATPSIVSGFATVYARSLGAAFRIGGASSTGVPGGLWRFDALGASTFEVFQPLALGTIQAVTYDAKARELIVLDQVGVRSATTMRLLRIDVFGEGSRIVKSWLRDGTCSKFSLLMDGRNRVVLSAKRGGTTNRHVLYSLAGEGSSFVSKRLRLANNLLASKPWSNELKLFLPVTTGSTSQPVSVVTQDHTVEGSVVDVAECF